MDRLSQMVYRVSGECSWAVRTRGVLRRCTVVFPNTTIKQLCNIQGLSPQIGMQPFSSHVGNV